MPVAEFAVYTSARVNGGDQQPGATRIAFAANQPYRADSPLLPSGLLGPVKVVSLGAVQ